MRRSLATFLGAAVAVAAAGQVVAGPATAAQAVTIAGPAVADQAVAGPAIAGSAVAGPAAVGPAPDGGVPGGNRNVCGTNYATIDLGRGDYFNVYNEQDHLSCVKAEKSVLSWTVTKRSGSANDWEYPHIGSGIDWGRYTCYDGRSAYPSSPGSQCMRYPVREKYDGTPLTSVQFWPHLTNGNVAYDIWFNKANISPSRLGQANGAEIMIWLMHPGITEPASRICWRTRIQGLWYDAMCWRAGASGRARWNYVAYIAEKQTRTLAPTWLNGFFRDAIRHGKVRQDWWLTAIDFGAEINTGGIGFAVRSYSLTDVR
jgi:Glycosyl hydrolase family 12